MMVKASVALIAERIEISFGRVSYRYRPAASAFYSVRTDPMAAIRIDQELSNRRAKVISKISSFVVQKIRKLGHPACGSCHDREQA